VPSYVSGGLSESAMIAILMTWVRFQTDKQVLYNRYCDDELQYLSLGCHLLCALYSALEVDPVLVFDENP